MNVLNDGVSDATESTKKRRPSDGRFFLVGITILVVAIVAWAGSALVFGTPADSQRGASPKPAVSATATAPTTPAPTTPAPTSPERTSSPEGEAKAPAAPESCMEVYPQTFLDQMADEELNHESMADSGISRYPAIEEFRKPLPGFECHWGLGTEGGIANAVNRVNREAQDEAIALIEANDHICEPHREGTICRQSEVLPDEEGTSTVWTIAEEHFFRDGLWVSTWWAGTASSIESNTSGIYTTIWP